MDRKLGAMHLRSASSRIRTPALVVACALLLVGAVVLVSGWQARSRHHHHSHPALPHATAADLRLAVTRITIDGAKPGLVFDGIGAISGGGGNSRLLIDYYDTHHGAQAQQILDYLFKPGYGASLQILKLEIGGDANATDGAEPSYQHAQGRVNCGAGYELWLAQQALRLDPHIKIYALQWNAPDWVGGGQQNPWTTADIANIIGWLTCAKNDGVTVDYVGGWNEHLPRGLTPQVINWFISLHKALVHAGFTSTRIVAVDSFRHMRGADVAKVLAGHPLFDKSVSVLGYHDICGHLSRPGRCQVPAAARTSRKPVWETELGALKPPGGYGAIARSVNDSYIQSGVTGTIEWPLLSSMPANLPVENLGLVQASQPWSGQFQVNQVTWVIAQTTQFTGPGWRHLRGGAGYLPAGGSYVSYSSPARTDWSMVAQTSVATSPQIISVHVDGGLRDSAVRVWSTKLGAASPSQVFARRAIVHPSGGTFRYQLSPGYIYTFTSLAGGGKCGGQRCPKPPPGSPMPIPYATFPDATSLTHTTVPWVSEPWGLSAMDGAFEYQPGSATTFAQTAVGTPDFWQPPKPPQPARFPYAVVGGGTWRDYTVGAQVQFTGPRQSAGLIARYDRPSFSIPVQEFAGYQFIVSASGHWRLLRDRVGQRALSLAAGVTRLGSGPWHAITLSVHHAVLIGRVDGKRVVYAKNSAVRSGVAGILTGGWYQVLFRDLTVTD